MLAAELRRLKERGRLARYFSLYRFRSRGNGVVVGAANALGQFTFHIFDRPDRALNAYETGHYNLDDRGRHAEDVLDKVGFEEIAVYGEDVLSRVKHGLTGPAQMDLEKVLETYMGRKTTAELMDLALGHSVHHLKQLYEYMSQAGMEPVDKLEDADFQGVAVPTELF